MQPIILESQRFYFREFDESDANDLFRLNQHPYIFRFTTDPPFSSVEEAGEFVRNYNAYQVNGFGRWAVISKSDDKFIGWCGLKYILEENEIDVGYRLLPEFWGKGIAVEAGKAVCEYGVGFLGINRIVARVHKENIQSIRVSEKLGMKYEKDLIYDGVPWLNYVYIHKSGTALSALKHFPSFDYEI